MFGLTTSIILGTKTEKTSVESKPLEILLSPIAQELDTISSKSESLNMSVHKFVHYITNGLLFSAIDIAERNHYPISLINEISNGKFAESMKDYQKTLYSDK